MSPVALGISGYLVKLRMAMPNTGPLLRVITLLLQRICTEAGARNLSAAPATASPPPSWGRDRVGGHAKSRMSGFPPPLTAPHKGEGNPVAPVANFALQPLASGCVQASRVDAAQDLE